MTIVREAVVSSNLAEIGYDAESSTLEVKFHPKKDGTAAIWRYTPVSTEEYEFLRSAPSIGSAFVQRIRNNPAIAGAAVPAEAVAS